MKQTDVQTSGQTPHRISNRMCSCKMSHTGMQPDKSLIRRLYVATDKRLYVPMQVFPDSHTAGWRYNPLTIRPDKQTNNRTVMRSSLRIYVQLSRFNNLIFNL
jgi:hypothetical protein